MFQPFLSRYISFNTTQICKHTDLHSFLIVHTHSKCLKQTIILTITPLTTTCFCVHSTYNLNAQKTGTYGKYYSMQIIIGMQMDEPVEQLVCNIIKQKLLQISILIVARALTQTQKKLLSLLVAKFINNNFVCTQKYCQIFHINSKFWNTAFGYKIR